MMNFLRRAAPLLSPVFQDLGTVSLGTAAIFLTRTFPTPQFSDFESTMMLATFFFALMGLLFRLVARALG